MGTFSKYSDIFLAVTMVMLAVSHWMGRKNKKRLNQVILWVSTVLAGAIIIYGKRAFLLSIVS